TDRQDKLTIRRDLDIVRQYRNVDSLDCSCAQGYRADGSIPLIGAIDGSIGQRNRIRSTEHCSQGDRDQTHAKLLHLYISRSKGNMTGSPSRLRLTLLMCVLSLS